ncbi:MAG: hypothetical protein ACRDSH_24565 [Pseudonocardiaceae bacterium]
MPVPLGQRSLDYEPQVLGRAAPGQGGAMHGGTAVAGTRGYAASHGPHSCSGCEARWTGSQAAHCAACHRTFSGPALFDAHRVLTGTHGACRDPGSLTAGPRPDTGEHIAVFREGMWRSPERKGPG